MKRRADGDSGAKFAVLCAVLVYSSIALGDDRPTYREIAEGKDEGTEWSGREAVHGAVKREELFHAKSRLELKWRRTSREPAVRRMDHLLVVSWFRPNGFTVLRYRVETSGKLHSVRDIWGWATQADHRDALGDAEMKRLRGALPSLPKSDDEPPIDRTVQVSFLDGKKWRTETYDAKMLPDEFEAVMKIIGERFETRGRHNRKAGSNAE